MVLPRHAPRRLRRWSSCTSALRLPPGLRRITAFLSPVGLSPHKTRAALLLLLACAAQTLPTAPLSPARSRCRPHREQARRIHSGPGRVEGCGEEGTGGGEAGRLGRRAAWRS